MRSALGKLPGVGPVTITRGERNFTVAYDDQKVTVDRMLEALREAGEPAKPAS